MGQNRYARPEVLAAIARLKFELTEEECRKRADRMDRQQSEEGRASIGARFRKSRSLPIR